MASFKNCKEYVNEIDWELTHEDAVTMYLEWGNNDFTDTRRRPVTSGDDYTIYFVVNTWGEPRLVLNKMNNFGATELCSAELPPELARNFMDSIGGLKGVHEPTEEIKQWVRAELEAN